MTQEDKELLLKDLCGRLPYGVKFRYFSEFADGEDPEFDNTITVIDVANEAILDEDHEDYIPIRQIMPYLRPMSSMTEEEKEDYFNVCDEDIKTLSVAMDVPDIIISDRGRTQGYVTHKELEWLYEHHFDFIRKIGDEYKTLTELGLAIEAPENMYNDKNNKHVKRTYTTGKDSF